MKSVEEASIQTEEQIVQYYKNLEKQAQELTPTILDDIRDFNVNMVSMDYYANYVAALNQGPIVATTNSVSYAIMGKYSKRSKQVIKD